MLFWKNTNSKNNPGSTLTHVSVGRPGMRNINTRMRNVNQTGGMRRSQNNGFLKKLFSFIWNFELRIGIPAEYLEKYIFVEETKKPKKIVRFL